MRENFTEPRRQSIIAILLIIQKSLKVIVRQIWPFILIFFVGGSASSYKGMILPVIIALSLFSTFWAVLSYFKYYFYIQDDELIIEKGVLSKTKLNIPFDRIQTVNFQQNIIHQLFNVKKLEIDTAGSAGNEFSMEALPVDVADDLRDVILERKSQLVQADAITPEKIENAVVETESLILDLSFIDLLKVGVSQNHFRSGGIILAGMVYFISQLSDLGLDVEGEIGHYIDNGAFPGLTILVSLIVVFLIVSFLISLTRTVFTYYNLNLWRVGNKYKLEKGLFNRRETSAVDQKIQIVEWSNNPLKKIFNYFDVRLKQASSVQVRSKQSIVIPGCHPEHVEYLKSNWLGALDHQNLDPQGVSIHFFIRKLMYRLLFAIILCVAVFKFYPSFIIIPILLIPYQIIYSWYSYKKKSFALNADVLYVGGGIFGDRHALMPLYKIQSVSMNQSPYESRRQLSTVRVMTASGSMIIPYIETDLATKIHDYLMYSIESSRKDWM